MTDIKLFDDQEKTAIADDERVVFQKENVLGALYMTWVNFRAFLRTIFVDKATDQTITSIKSFNKSPLVPDPTEELHAVNLRSLLQLISNPEFDSIAFNTDPPIITDAGTIQWNNKEYTLNVSTGLGATIQSGLETLILFYNDTGATVTNFSVMHLKSAIESNNYLYKTFELAIANDHEKCQGTLAIATHDIPDGQLGFLTIHGDASDGDTSALIAGGQNWISATQAGKITSTKPQFPDYAISLGGAYNSSATEGKIWVNILGSVNDTFNDAWDGAIRESFNFIVGSVNGVILGELKNVDPLLNLTCIFSDVGLYTFDTTSTDVAIQLTAGTDELTVTNFVFIPMSTKALTVNISGFPDTEHCKVAVIECQSAANIELRGGARGNQNVNDHIKKETNNGHVLHITEWIRRQFATHISGAEATLSVGDLPNGYISATGGQVSQLHEQTTQALSMPTNLIMIANDPDIPYRETDNLNTITKYSDGSNFDKWGKVVVWLIANKTGQPDFLCLNLPREGENDSAKALLDEKNRADYSIPSKYKSKAILLAAFSIEIDGGDVEYTGATTGYQDLRGTIPSNIAGGGGGGGVASLLALDDVFINDYAGKARQKVLVTDDELGVDSFPDPENIIANQGVGLLADRPLTGLTIGDVYVATDILLKYTALTATTWDSGVALIEKQFVTSEIDISQLLYQFNGVSLQLVSTNFYSNTIVENIDWTNISYNDLDVVFGADWETKNGVKICVIDSATGAGHPIGVSGTYSLRLTRYIDSSNAHRLEAIDTNVAAGSILSNNTIPSISWYNIVVYAPQTITTATAVTPTGNLRENEQNITALATGITINAPSGTAINNNKLKIRIKDNGTSQSIDWSTFYTIIAGVLPTSTTPNEIIYFYFEYNDTSLKWELIYTTKKTDVVSDWTYSEVEYTTGGPVNPTGDSVENKLIVTQAQFTITINAPSGTAIDGHKLRVRIKDNGSSSPSIVLNSIYRQIGVTIPSNTGGNGKVLYFDCAYNSQDTKWDIISTSQEV